MKEELEKFILSDSKEPFDYIDDEREYFNKKYLKINYNHRFDILYSQRLYKNKMNNDSFSFAGFYDKIDKVIYNADYDLRDVLKDKDIKFDEICNLKRKIYKDMNEYIKNYTINNQDELRQLYHNNFYDNEKPFFRRIEEDVERHFITTEDTVIEIPYFAETRYDANYEYDKVLLEDSNSIYTDYLDNPEQTIKEKSKVMLNEETTKKRIGFMLNHNEFENNYLSKIFENKNNEYASLYKNKELYKAIKDVETQMINITINYNGDELTFKFSKYTFQCALERNYKSECSYNKSYESVEKFLEEHKEQGYKKEFDFLNITKITYGKNTLYEKQEDKELENDEHEMEMEY